MLRNINQTYSNNSFYKFILYLFAIVTLLQCNSIYMFSSPIHISKGLINVAWQILLVVLLYASLKNNKSHVKNNRLSMFMLIFSFIILCFLIFDFIFYPTFSKTFGIKISLDIILLVLFFNNNFSEDKSAYPFIIFDKVVVVISCISLIFWIAYILGIPTNTSTFIKWGMHQYVQGYFGIDFFTQTNQKFLGLAWQRNSGIFAEASMFSYVVTIALLIELFIKKHKKPFNYRIIILLITIISTASTTGILVSFIAFAYYVFLTNKHWNILTLMLLILVPILIIFLKAVFLDKSGSSQINDAGSSSSIRYDDIKAGFKAWRYHILLGDGLGKDDMIVRNMSLWRFIRFINVKPASSAGFSTILAEGGILLGLFYTLPAILVSKYSKELAGLALFSFIPFIFVTSQGFYIYLMLLSYFWTIYINNNSKSIYVR